MSSNEDRPFFLSQIRGLKTAVPEDDYLHPKVNAAVSDDSLTETQYFGLCLPEHRIHGLMQCWHHPNLKVVTGGVWVWQGMKPQSIACEMFDYRSFMSDRPLDNDLGRFRLANGYGVEIIEPLKRHHVTYTDPERGNALDLMYEAIAPPIVWGDGKHFEQPMKVRGSLRLAGKDYEVNSYNIRDRSWGKPRQEALFAIPPVNWMTGMFGEDFYFNCTAIDHPDLGPDWKEFFPDFKSEQTLMGGWVQRDGLLGSLVSCEKRTVRDSVTLMPDVIEFTMIDEHSRSFTIKGKLIAGSIIVAWPNSSIVVAMTRWECDGRVGYGDSQEAQFHDFVRKTRMRQAETVGRSKQ